MKKAKTKAISKNKLDQINEEESQYEKTSMMPRDYAENEFDVLDKGQKDLQKRKTIRSEKEKY